MANERHGIVACVFLDVGAGYAQLAVASGFSVGETGSECEVLRLEDTCITRLRGAIDSAGSITGYHDQEAKVLQAAAQSQTAIPMLIYPECDDSTTLYSVSAFFDYDHTGDATSCQTLTAPWRGAACLEKVGFS
ncbi:MAG: hypothetical protein KKC55_15010 [Gammaproteobacteria bacterium]|nr:hypothetical protein [Gammaproteobacteria bacterium]